jgi:hypothetical protein
MVMGHLNPRLPYVPAFLVNFVLKVASPVIFKLMKKVTRPPHLMKIQQASCFSYKM